MQLKLHRAFRVALNGRNDQYTFQPGVYAIPADMEMRWAENALSRGPAFAEEIKPAPAVETKAPIADKPAPKRRGRPRKKLAIETKG